MKVTCPPHLPTLLTMTNRHHLASLVILAIGFAVQARADEASPNTLTKDEAKDGFKLLFDGKSLDGWRVYGKKDATGWEVKDGAIYIGKGAGDLMTAEKYANFELLIDFKFEAGNNSGLIYRVLETKEPSYMSGPEMQVMHHKSGDKLGKNSGGSLYDLYAPSENPFKGADVWTTYKLVCDGNKIQHYVNGVKVVDVEIGSADWNERMAKSKWSKAKNFATQTTGHIALQDHGSKVSFRNIKIRVLP